MKETVYEIWVYVRVIWKHEAVNWIILVQGRDQWRTVVNTAMNFQVLYKESISRRAERMLASQEWILFIEYKIFGC
jgi:hypothetical protein